MTNIPYAHPDVSFLDVPGPAVLIERTAVQEGDIRGIKLQHGDLVALVLGEVIRIGDVVIERDQRRVVTRAIEEWHRIRIELAGVAGYGMSVKYAAAPPLAYVAAGEAQATTLPVGDPRVVEVRARHGELRRVRSPRARRGRVAFADEFLDGAGEPVAVYATFDDRWLLGFMRGNVLVAPMPLDVDEALVARQAQASDPEDDVLVLDGPQAALVEAAARRGIIPPRSSPQRSSGRPARGRASTPVGLVDETGRGYRLVDRAPLGVPWRRIPDRLIWRFAGPRPTGGRDGRLDAQGCEGLRSRGLDVNPIGLIVRDEIEFAMQVLVTYDGSLFDGEPTRLAYPWYVVRRGQFYRWFSEGGLGLVGTLVPAAEEEALDRELPTRPSADRVLAAIGAGPHRVMTADDVHAEVREFDVEERDGEFVLRGWLFADPSEVEGRRASLDAWTMGITKQLAVAWCIAAGDPLDTLLAAARAATLLDGDEWSY